MVTQEKKANWTSVLELILITWIMTIGWNLKPHVFVSFCNQFNYYACLGKQRVKIKLNEQPLYCKYKIKHTCWSETRILALGCPLIFSAR